MEEVWKPVPGYEGIYEVSNAGRVKSLKRFAVDPNGRKRLLPEKILKLKTEKAGREDFRVTLWKDAVCDDYLVSRLIAMAFLPLPYDKLTVNHINGDYQDNRVENLEWVTLRENIQHGFATGLYESTQKKVSLIPCDGGETLFFDSMAEASRFVGKNHGYISDKINKSYRYAFGKNGETYVISLEEGEKNESVLE